MLYFTLCLQLVMHIPLLLLVSSFAGFLAVVSLGDFLDCILRDGDRNGLAEKTGLLAKEDVKDGFGAG